MDQYVVSALKYRPDSFEKVVGQEHVTNTLKNALKLDELAHSFLFSGPRGVGKTTCARILAKTINCENPGPDREACNECNSCRSFIEGRSLNIHELDAASNNSVEDIRKIIEQVRYIPSTGSKSVFIIDEVHMLSQAAFNAFLKTLEEPPEHAIFILATTEKHKILPTILSRCQKYDFRRIKVNNIAEHLKGICEKEEITYEYEGLQVIALKADGALRDALSIFDQLVSFSGKNITYKMVLENLNVLDYAFFFRATDLIIQQDHAALLLLLNEIIELGFDPKEFLVGLTEHFRNLLICQTPETVNLLETSDNVKKTYLEMGKTIPGTFLLNAFHICSEIEQKLKNSPNPRLNTELGLIKLAYLNSALDIAKDDHPAEKKKLTPEIKPPSTPAQSTEAQTITSQNSESTPVADSSKTNTPAPVDNAQNEATAATPPGETNAKSIAESIRSTITIRKKSQFSIPNNLDEVSVPEKTAEELLEQEEKKETEFATINESITIGREQFEEVMDKISAELNDNSQPILASVLKKENSTLVHNKWILKVGNEIQKKQLLAESELVSRFRKMIPCPELFLEIEVHEMKAEDLGLPYTSEERLQAMEEKNPALRELMKKFDTILNY